MSLPNERSGKGVTLGSGTPRDVSKENEDQGADNKRGISATTTSNTETETKFSFPEEDDNKNKSTSRKK
jgi:hypothetical protein